MRTKSTGRVTTWYAKPATREFIDNSLKELYPDESLTEGLTQGAGDSSQQVAAWIELVLPFGKWVAASALWNATAAPFLKSLFSELGKSTGKSLPELVKNFSDRAKEQKRIKLLGDIVRQASLLEGKPIGLVLGVPLNDGASSCCLSIETANLDTVDDQIAAFFALSEGFQEAAKHLKLANVPYANTLIASLQSDGLNLSWLDTKDLKPKTIVVAFSDQVWIVKEKPFEGHEIAQDA